MEKAAKAKAAEKEAESLRFEMRRSADLVVLEWRKAAVREFGRLGRELEAAALANEEEQARKRRITEAADGKPLRASIEGGGLFLGLTKQRLIVLEEGAATARWCSISAVQNVANANGGADMAVIVGGKPWVTLSLTVFKPTQLMPFFQTMMQP